MKKPGSELKILQVGPLPPPIGGMAVVVENLLCTLEKHCQVRLHNNAKTTSADRSLFQGIMAQLRLVMRLCRLVLYWRPDVVHIHTCSWFTFWRNALDVMLVHLLGGKVVLHIHGAQFHRFLKSFNLPKAWMARRVFQLCDRVVVLGEEWRSVLSGWVEPERIAVVPNGVPVSSKVFRKWHTPQRITCVANYERRKGQSDLLRAVAELSNSQQVKVALLGSEAELGMRGRLQSLAEDLGITDQIDIPGPKLGLEKKAYLDRTDIFCLPSYDEGLPMAMLEAMAEGIPVIVTRVGAIPEAVTDGQEGYLYNAGDVAALCKSIVSILDNPAQALKMGQAGHKRLLQEFSIELSVERLMLIYKELV